MDKVLHIGGGIVDNACLVLFAAMNDESYRPAVTLAISLDAGIATIDTVGFRVNGPDSVKVGGLDTLELFDISLVKSDEGHLWKSFSTSCTLQAHAIDVSKANWYANLKLYEWAGLTDWRDPKYARLRKWKNAWWQLMLDTFDLEMD